jgi:multiple sugar transport system permease protein
VAHSLSGRDRTLSAVLYAVIAVVGIAFVFPFFWMLVSSVKLNRDVLAFPVRFFPPVWNWKSYVNVFTAFPDFHFLRFILNSVIVTVCAVLLCLVLSATAGYGFAKFKFKGNAFLFMVVLATIMISFEAIVVPLFILIRQMGMPNTYAGLIIPESLTAFGVFMMRQFFFSLPDDFIESARIDGANEYRIFISIGLPMAKTALLALVIWPWYLALKVR